MRGELQLPQKGFLSPPANDGVLGFDASALADDADEDGAPIGGGEKVVGAGERTLPRDTVVSLMLCGFYVAVGKSRQLGDGLPDAVLGMDDWSDEEVEAVGVCHFDGGGQVGGARVQEAAGGVWNAGHFRLTAGVLFEIFLELNTILFFPLLLH